MATDLERLTVLIEANTRSYERAMLRLQQTTDKAIRGASKSITALDKSLKNASKTAQATGLAFAKVFGGAFVISGLAQIPGALRDIVKNVADMGDLAERIGITTDALQELSFQARQAGSSTEEMAAGLEQFSKRVGEASQGSGDLFKLFQANNVALRDAAGNLRPINELLAEFANLLQGASSEAERAAIAVDGFGKAGAPLGLVFQDGAGGIALAAQKAHELSQVINSELFPTARDLDDEFDQLTGAIGNFIQTEVLIFIRDLVAGLNSLSDAAQFVKDAYTTSSQEARARLEEINVKVKELQAQIAQDTEFGIDTEFASKRLASLLRQAQELRAQLAQEYDPLTSIKTPGSIPSSPIRPTILPPKPPPGGGGRGGGGRDSAADAVKREKENVTELIAELERERELIGSTDVERRISNELREAGAVATEAQKARIIELITAIEAEEAAQERLIAILDEVRSAADSALGSFVQELIEAKSPLDALKAGLVDVLNTIIRIAQQQAIVGLFGASGGVGGGIFGNIFKGLTGAPNVTSVAPATRQSSGQAVAVHITATPSPLLHLTIDQKSAAAEERAIARGPAVARNNNLRYAVP